jgi:hypothetical protein
MKGHDAVADRYLGPCWTDDGDATVRSSGAEGEGEGGM